MLQLEENLKQQKPAAEESRKSSLKSAASITTADLAEKKKGEALEGAKVEDATKADEAKENDDPDKKSGSCSIF